MNPKLTTSKSEKLLIAAKPFSSGGEGEVYHILNKEYSQQCVKIYHKKYRTETRRKKLEYMISHPPKELYGDTYKICWPQEIVFLDDQFVGFIMPLAYKNSTLLYGLCTTQITFKYSYHWWKKFNRYSKDGVISRLKLCVNLSVVLKKVYNESVYVFVDLKPQNVMITKNGKVCLIDLDSIQIAEGENLLFKARVATPNYTPPEGDQYKEDDVIPQSWDLFSLAVIFYQILFGIHPYAATAKLPFNQDHSIQYKIKQHLFVHGKHRKKLSLIPKPHHNFNLISTELQSLFNDSFNHISHHIERPILTSWGKMLFKEILLTKTGFVDHNAVKTNEHHVISSFKWGLKMTLQPYIDTILKFNNNIKNYSIVKRSGIYSFGSFLQSIVNYYFDLDSGTLTTLISIFLFILIIVLSTIL